MTATDIARRLLETDEDFDPTSEMDRYLSSEQGDIKVKSEFNHWDVFRRGHEHDILLGSVYHNDMEDAPAEMTPEARASWEAIHWIANPLSPRQPATFHTSFADAVKALANPVNEAVDPDDPQMFLQKFGKERSVPVEMEVFNNLGRLFRVQIVWDQTAGGTVYDGRGRKVIEKPQPIVRFYDMEHARNPDYQNSTIWKNGQFVSSYYASTLMERPTGGLDLVGHEPAWKIDARAMDKVRAWIKAEVEGRGYKLVNDEAGGISFGMRYEGLDPDDPELYAHPERYTQQPSDEKIEGELRRMLAPYYTRVNINKRPGLFANRELIQRDVPGEPEGAEHRVPFKDGWVWTIHCNRDTPLPLPPTRPYVGHRGPDPNSWRNQIKSWFEKWARDSGLYLFGFEVYGRLRKDPTFQFQTARIGPLKEALDDPLDDPERFLSNHLRTIDWDKDLAQDLWKFHPYGVGYNVIGWPRGAYAVATTYFDPDKDNYAARFRDFVVNWLREKRIMPLKIARLYTFPHANRPKEYPQWSVIAAINVPWADPDLAEHAPAVEIGEPGVLPGGSDTAQP